jgi:hypothetical protein
MSHCVHAAVDRMQPATPDPPCSRAAAQAQSSQLRPGHHTLLPRRELRNSEVTGWDEKCMTVVHFSSHP